MRFKVQLQTVSLSSSFYSLPRCPQQPAGASHTAVWTQVVWHLSLSSLHWTPEVGLALEMNGQVSCQGEELWESRQPCANQLSSPLTGENLCIIILARDLYPSSVFHLKTLFSICFPLAELTQFTLFAKLSGVYLPPSLTLPPTVCWDRQSHRVMRHILPPCNILSD